MEEQEAGILLGRRIRALRLRRELTQEALGERAGLNYKYLGGSSAASAIHPSGSS
jgi:transcriptional regulator with XRE-family HTH domain